jgi:hypothetical protein
MEEKEKTRVVFCLIPNEPQKDEVIAFLYDVPANSGNVMSYMHTGQHSEASKGFSFECKLASPEQYSDLKTELELLGYELQVMFNQ